MIPLDQALGLDVFEPERRPRARNRADLCQLPVAILTKAINRGDRWRQAGIGGLAKDRDVYFASVWRHHWLVTETPTLARQLGTATHLSPLLRKARRLGLDAHALEQLAIQRGCDYYDTGEPLPSLFVSIEEFSNAELAIALLNPALRYRPQTLRLGAAMLAAPGNDPADLAYLAELERAETIVRYIVECGRKFEPNNPFWTILLRLLPQRPPPRSSVVPHPTRFVAMTGITRRGVETLVEWIRPPAPAPVHG